MASTIAHNLITEPHLLDIVDDEWARDTLPDDGASVAGSLVQERVAAAAPCLTVSPPPAQRSRYQLGLS